MSKIRMITDSGSDISTSDEKELNIGMLNFKVAIGDKSYISREDFDNEQFYQLMAEHEELPTTSQITPFEFEELYGEYHKEGYTDIILVLINKEGSATYNNAIFAKDNYFDEHPEHKEGFNIYVIDGKSYSGGYGYAVVCGAKMIIEGKPADEVAKAVTEIINNSRIYFGIYELKYAAKSGRIPTAAALVGDVVGIKPIMRIWDHSITTALKCRGEKKVMAGIVKTTVAEMIPDTEYSVVYGNDIKLKEDMEAAMTKAVGYPPVKVFQIGAAVATNAGPRVVGTIFQTKEK